MWSFASSKGGSFRSVEPSLTFLETRVTLLGCICTAIGSVRALAESAAYRRRTLHWPRGVGGALY